MTNSNQNNRDHEQQEQHDGDGIFNKVTDRVYVRDANYGWLPAVVLRLEHQQSQSSGNNSNPTISLDYYGDWSI